MIIVRKNIFFIFISFSIIASGNAELTKAQLTKIDSKNMQHFGIRYLDHLEYATPKDALNNAKKYHKQSFDPNKYINLINQHYESPVYIAFIDNDVGYGIFAAQNIKKGQLIGEYTGIVKSINFSKKNEDFEYAWGFPPPIQFVIDSKEAGNFTRFVNHSSEPNVDMIYVPINNRWHLAYVANQDIKKDQQLLVNYGKLYWQGRNIKPRDLK